MTSPVALRVRSIELFERPVVLRLPFRFGAATVTDLNGKEADKAKFASASEKVEGHPVATFGKNKTMILVKDRYQVSASSQTLDHEARKSLISKFDLRGLSAL